MNSATFNIFKAYDIRGKVGTELDTTLSFRIGATLAEWLPTDGVVAVGRDMRPDSQELADAFIDGLRAQGRDVWDIGQVTSDMIYFAVGNYSLAGGAVITASHNPGAYNGIKIYRDKVTPVGLDTGLAEIRDTALSDTVLPTRDKGSIIEKNITKEWVGHALSMVDPKTWPTYRIAIDAGNGMAGAILPHVLPALPITAEEMYFTPDGTFPNHEANPQNEENLRDLVSAIQKNQYDFGIAFDGDGDRAAFIDDIGRPVLGTDVISIVAKYILKHHPESEIIHDVRTSKATQELIEEWGGTPVRTKAGRVYIGALLRERGAQFGGETTGHLFFADNYDADSGLIAALVFIQALAQSGKKLSELVDEYRRYVMPREINIETTEKDLAFARLKEVYKDAQLDELDGLTVTTNDGWFNLRASNTEPVMRLTIEGNTEADVESMLSEVSSATKQADATT